MIHDAVVDLVGVLQAAGDAGIVGGKVGNFRFPAFDRVPRRRGIGGRDSIRSSTVEMHTDGLHIFRRIRVAHSRSGEAQIISKGFRHHDNWVEPSRIKGRTQVGPDVGVEVRGRPKTGLVVCIVIGFVLHRKGIGCEAVGILHSRSPTRLIGRVSTPIGMVHLVGVATRVAVVVASVIAAGIVIVLPLCRRAPGCSEDPHVGVLAQGNGRRRGFGAPIGVPGFIDEDAVNGKADLPIHLIGWWLARIVLPKGNRNVLECGNRVPNAGRSEARDRLIGRPVSDRYGSRPKGWGGTE